MSFKIPSSKKRQRADTASTESDIKERRKMDRQPVSPPAPLSGDDNDGDDGDDFSDRDADADGDTDTNDNPLSAPIDALKSVKRFATAADQKRVRDSLFTDAAANRKTAIKSQIRSAQRLLTRTSIPAPIKSRKEAEVRILQTRLLESQRKQKVDKYLHRYARIRFFEKRKLLRQENQLIKRLQTLNTEVTQPGSIGADEAAIRASLAKVRADIDYVNLFPHGMKYIALFPAYKLIDKYANTDATESDDAAERAHAEQLSSDIAAIRQQVERRKMKSAKMERHNLNVDNANDTSGMSRYSGGGGGYNADDADEEDEELLLIDEQPQTEQPDDDHLETTVLDDDHHLDQRSAQQSNGTKKKKHKKKSKE